MLGQSAFKSCSSITNLTLPNRILVIEEGAFNFIGSCCTDILYTGTKEQWDAIDIEDDNRHFDSEK